jgi:hypothetical protein
MLKIILPTILLISAFQAKAIVYQNSHEAPKAIISLTGMSLCTGTVVGLNPPTVITARHCVETDSILFEDASPTNIVTDDFKNFEFDMNEEKMPGDLAILIFDQKDQSKFNLTKADLFSVEQSKMKEAQSVSFCGYGLTTPYLPIFPSLPSFKLACGTNFLILDDPSLGDKTINEIAKQYPNKYSNQLPPDMNAKVTRANVQSFLTEYAPGTRMGIAFLFPPTKEHPYGVIDTNHKLSLVNQGDSGGPIFTKNAKKEKVILGVASLTMHTAVSTGPQDQITGGVFWSLNHEWSRALLQKAKALGADIKGL